MEGCKPQAISRATHFLNPSLPHKHSSISLPHQGVHSYKCSSLRSTKSDDTSSGTNQFLNAKSDHFKKFADKQPYEVTEYSETTPIETPDDEPGSVVHDETRLGETFDESSLLDVKKKIAEFVDQLNLKFDSEDYSIVLYGSSAAAALYLATAVVGAIDSIPLFPKLMEVVGLGYSVWFINRYLLFKKNRDEIAAKIEELKQQVLGSDYE